MGSLPTVVITTLDRLEYLREAVASVQAQDLQRELIVIDNGSSDGTAEWLSTLDGVVTARVKRDPNRSRCANIAIARNAGLRLASGDCVWFLDDDDRLRPGALALLAGALDGHPKAVLAVGARTRFGAEKGGGRIAHPLSPMVRDVCTEILLGWGFVPSQTLCRTSTVREVGGWGEQVPCAEDLELWARLVARGLVVLRPEIVVEYRVHRSQSRLEDPASSHDALMRPYAVSLANGDQARGLRLRDAGLRWERANDAFAHDQPGHALTSTIRAMVKAPEFLRSPLLRPLSTRMLVRSALRCSGPTRRWVEARAERPPGDRPRRGTGFLS